MVTMSDCRCLNANLFDYVCMTRTCGVSEWHALLLGKSLLGHFRDQSRLQLVQAATTERINARCVVWQGACLLHVRMAG